MAISTPVLFTKSGFLIFPSVLMDELKKLVGVLALWLKDSYKLVVLFNIPKVSPETPTSPSPAITPSLIFI